jgi:hypothetical protein
MNEATITTATLPRSILVEAFEIAVLCQQRRDFVCDEAGREFPSHKLMEFINAAEKIGLANVVLVEDPPPTEITEQVPWEQDSMSDSVKSPCTHEDGGVESGSEAALE